MNYFKSFKPVLFLLIMLSIGTTFGQKAAKSYSPTPIQIYRLGSEQDTLTHLKGQMSASEKEAVERESKANKEALYKKGEIDKESTYKKLHTPHQAENTQKTLAPVIPIVRENFEANNMVANVTPADGSVAISNDGFIVSVDNGTIEYYQTNGVNGTPLTVQLTWENFFNGFANIPVLPNSYFDPVVLYDDVEDRFVLVICNSTTPATSQILICFSQSNNPFNNDWFAYAVPGHSPNNNNTWFDRPWCALNQGDLFISGNIYLGVANSFESARILQIPKMNGYNNAANLGGFNWDYFNDEDGNTASSLIPAGYGQENMNYGRNGIYFVSTVPQSIPGATRIYWYDITGNVGDPGVQLVTHGVDAPQPYAPANTNAAGGQVGSSQFGTADFLDPGDCRTSHAFYLNGEIHFVHSFDAGNNWSGISYNRIDVAANAIQEMTLSDVGGNDYTYPCISSFGLNANDESVMIGFLRTGPNLYPQVCVINADDNAWGPITIVRDGDGFVDLAAGNWERWGDYTTMQRKHNEHAVWMIGQYGFGAVPNAWNVTHGFDSYVAEIGDVPVVSIENPIENKAIIYPNPSQESFKITLSNGQTAQKVLIHDLQGRLVKEMLDKDLSNDIKTTNLPSGIYSLQIVTNNATFYEKLSIIR